MFWKFIARILRCQKKDYVKHRIGKNIFVVSIRRHVPIKEMMKKAAGYGVFAAEKRKIGRK